MSSCMYANTIKEAGVGTWRDLKLSSKLTQIVMLFSKLLIRFLRFWLSMFRYHHGFFPWKGIVPCPALART
jgi:hypothetical protein